MCREGWMGVDCDTKNSRFTRVYPFLTIFSHIYYNMDAKDSLQAEKPAQMSPTATVGRRRMLGYKSFFVLSAASIVGWWFWTSKAERDMQQVAVDKWGRHGENRNITFESF